MKKHIERMMNGDLFFVAKEELFIPSVAQLSIAGTRNLIPHILVL
jgi:hypothetical protein